MDLKDIISHFIKNTTFPTETTTPIQFIPSVAF